MTKQGGNQDNDKDIQLDTLNNSTTININGNDASNSQNASPNINNNSLALFGVDENAYESDSDYTTDTEETTPAPSMFFFIYFILSYPLHNSKIIYFLHT